MQATVMSGEVDQRLAAFGSLLDRCIAMPRHAKRSAFLSSFPDLRIEIGPVLTGATGLGLDRNAPAPAFMNADEWAAIFDRPASDRRVAPSVYWAVVADVIGVHGMHGWQTKVPNTRLGSASYFSRRNGGSASYRWIVEYRYSGHILHVHRLDEVGACRLAVAADLLSEFSHEVLELITADTPSTAPGRDPLLPHNRWTRRKWAIDLVAGDIRLPLHPITN